MEVAPRYKLLTRLTLLTMLTLFTLFTLITLFILLKLLYQNISIYAYILLRKVRMLLEWAEPCLSKKSDGWVME